MGFLGLFWLVEGLPYFLLLPKVSLGISANQKSPFSSQSSVHCYAQDPMDWVIIAMKLNSL